MNTRTKLALSLTVVSLALGFMISLQYRQTEMATALGVGNSEANTVDKHLNSQLSALKTANSEAEKQLTDVLAQVSNYEKQSTGSNAQLKELQTRLQDERILAGITPVHGPGISVVLMDGAATGSDVEQVLTHDWNVRSVINELFTAGAEAVSINGYRVVATSAVTCQGPVVTVNDHRLGAPFQIAAIGDPPTLKSALEIQGGILDLLRQDGLRVSDPVMQTDIQMPAFTGSLQAGGNS